MSKELEALERLMQKYYEMCIDTNNNDDEYQKHNLTSEYAIIETALLQLESIRNNYCVCEKDAIKKLRALEIIKNKRVQVHILLESNNLEEYNESIYVCEGVKYKLTQEEFDLLKEVLGD